MDNNTRIQLLSLIRSELFGSAIDPELFVSCDWNALTKLAKEQTVHGLMMQGKNSLPQELQPERKTNLRMVGAASKIQVMNENMNKAVAAINVLYRKMGINPLIMKGQVMAVEYPHPYYRNSGDIDICFRTENEAQKAYRWARESDNCKCFPIVNEKEQPFSWHGIVIENHLRIADMMYGPYQEALQKLLRVSLENDEPRFVEIGGQMIETLPCTLTLFYLIVHLEYHLLNEGVGLRQFCDIAVYTVNHSTELRRETIKLNSWLCDCGLERIAAAIGWVLVQELGVKEDVISWNLYPDNMSKSDLLIEADKIMEEVWEGGNFGKNIWGWKGSTGFIAQKFRALPLHWVQYRKYRHLLPHEAWANFTHKFIRATRGVK